MNIPIKITNKKVLLTVGFLLSFFMFAEVCLRIYHYIKDGNPVSPKVKYFSTFTDIKTQNKIFSSYDKVDFEYTPYLLWRALPGQKEFAYTTNSQGLRGKDWTQKEKGTFRIIITGGSTAWGYGASTDSNTIEGFLQNNLQNYFNLEKIPMKAEVLNAAEIGYTSSQEIIVFRNILNYKPDLIMNFDGFNDFYVGLLSKPAGWNQPFAGETVIANSKASSVKIFAKSLLTKIVDSLMDIFKMSYIFQSVSYHTKLDMGFNDKRPSYTSPAAISDMYLLNTKVMSDIAKGEHIPFAVVLQPTLLEGNTKILSVEEEKLISAFDKDYPSADIYYEEVHGLMERGLNNMALENRLMFQDGSNYFSNISNNIYFHPVHFSDQGNKIVADKLLLFIIQHCNFKTKIAEVKYCN